MASIIINSPVAGEVYQAGDGIAIQAIAISSEDLHGYDVFITKANDTTSYFFTHIHDHNDTVVINQNWKSTVPVPELEVNVTIYLDHELHALKKKVAFKIQ